MEALLISYPIKLMQKKVQTKKYFIFSAETSAEVLQYMQNEQEVDKQNKSSL